MAQLFYFAFIALLGGISAGVVPDESGGVPDLGGGVPDLGGGVPDLGGGVPDLGGGVPDLGGGVPDLAGSGGLPKLPVGLPTDPFSVLKVLLGVKVEAQLNCANMCPCFLTTPVSCVPKLSILGLPLALAAPNPADLTKLLSFSLNYDPVCLTFAAAVKLSLVKLEKCYANCITTKQVCDNILALELIAAVAIAPPICQSDPEVKVFLGAVVKLDLCNLFLTRKEASCEPCSSLPALTRK